MPRAKTVQELMEIWFDDISQSLLRNVKSNRNFNSGYYLTLPSKGDVVREWQRSQSISDEFYASKVEDLKHTIIDYINDYEKEIEELKQELELCKLKK